ncbi:putative tetratricopeptide-like helical domain superfamily [Helianthus annuus]|uniref:Putative tetratricopeptide-like helical domain-containing protein n=1 Tax=Helianthus annuus TaxID=4232 RepID=A0A251S8D4_HELAN|nr:putative pentatricopeptide repeat-containing protein At5g52630 [Helianthus annuus]KAF5764476.1 putative tetratricopeptide-like helical domain superfamily [Helianthus annuus]KAJ0451141.1 putative tetratricopeptide-like helical domain superfamily [Helianthus annuus]KAJ0455558.1 putative tetratricopeptide-like helical domain superfamily [Helianthus annuus]KAJ0473012.1 putative tetratricopeptide-like helical domain superfamily [Helianthus annuus]KAJ0648615.1 putative tetratricopeptide-like heli
MFSKTPQYLDSSIHESLNNLLTKFSQTNNFKSIKQLHTHLLKTGIIFISYTLQTNLTYSYTICSQQNTIKTLTKLFNSSIITHPVPFNSIISSFVRNGYPFVALKTLSFMHVNGVNIDTYALCSSLTACCLTKSGFGKQVHTHVVKSGWGCSVFLGSALVDFYAKSMGVGDARKVFDEMPVRNTVCANALLSGYADAKMWVEGTELFRSMPGLNLWYDNWTFTVALSVCCGLYAIESGSEIHAKVIRTVHDPGTDVFLLSSLIDLYGKCGMVVKAKQVFNMARLADVVLWTAMLGVYGRNGRHEEVIRLFKQMLMKKIRPDGVAFVTVISACGHTGQVDLGAEYFESMARDFGLSPSPEHYGCLVDLFCRAGELEKAWNVVNKMPNEVSASVTVWGALLNACCDHGHVDLGKFAARRALELDPMNTGIYVLLSNMFAKCGLWDEIERLRELMRDKGIKKDIGCSWTA